MLALLAIDRVRRNADEINIVPVVYFTALKVPKVINMLLKNLLLIDKSGISCRRNVYFMIRSAFHSGREKPAFPARKP